MVDLLIVFLGEGATVPRDSVGVPKESPDPDLTMPEELVEPADGERTMGDEGPELVPPAVGADEVLRMFISKLVGVEEVLEA